MKLGAVLNRLALASLVVGCAAMPTLTERPEDYHLYRAARIAPSQEERLRAADRYLREVPDGPHRKELRAWFDKAENAYYLAAFQRLPQLYTYQAVLPKGPHIAEVRARIVALEARRSRRRDRASDEDARIAATRARLERADARRRAFVTTFKDWAARLIQIKSFGEPTTQLSEETNAAFHVTLPRGSCDGDTCRKLLELHYEVPGEGELVSRAALLEIGLELDSGRLRAARLAGPELWTRLAEALSLQPLPSARAEQRADAVQRSSLLVRALLEPALPAAECESKATAEPQVIVERLCRGVRARMLAGQSDTDDDVLEIAAAPAPVAAPTPTPKPKPKPKPAASGTPQ